MAVKPKTSDPWYPAAYDEHIIAAVKAWQVGNASEAQQQTAFRWVVEIASGYYGQPFRPGGPDGARATDFACGRLFVGQQIVKMTKLVTPGGKHG